MSHTEKEIKILNVDAKETIKKMSTLGVEPKGKYIQDVYTFDFPTVDKSFYQKLKIAQDTKDKKQIIDLIKDIRPCFTKEYLKKFNEILGTEDIISYINENEDLSKLNNMEINETNMIWMRLEN